MSPHAEAFRYDILVLGIGNLVWGDDGFGVHAVRELVRRFDVPGTVELMDGGSQGLYLLPHVQASRRLLLLDAVDCGAGPGELVVLTDAEVPRFMGAHKVSMHQSGFQEVLSAAELLGETPESMTLVGGAELAIHQFRMAFQRRGSGRHAWMILTMRWMPCVN
ncbi:MAG: hydrogenase 1 maturation protease, partial [Rhodospirillaceae bacterium]